MLPPKELSARCPRCAADLDDATDICPSCGADRALELRIRGELDPTIRSVRLWLLFIAAAITLVSGLAWSHYHGSVPDEQLLPRVVPPLVLAAILVGLALAVRRLPFVAPLIALILFALTYAGELLQPPDWVRVDLSNVWRLILLIVFVDAVRRGWRARQLRAGLEVPPETGESIPVARVRR